MSNSREHNMWPVDVVEVCTEVDLGLIVVQAQMGLRRVRQIV